MDTLNTILQAVNAGGVVLIVVLVGIMLARGLLVSGVYHAETVKLLREVIDDQRQQIARLEARLATMEDYRAPH